MTRDEAWLVYSKRDEVYGEPGEEAAFEAGWAAHEESLKQSELVLSGINSLTNLFERDTAGMIYQFYPLKKARPVAIRAIQKQLKRHSADYLLKQTKAFAAAVAEWPEEDKQFIPMPATFFNQERFLDDPSTWVRFNGQAPKSQFSRSY